MSAPNKLRRWCLLAIRGTLGLLLLGSCALKLIGGHQPEYALKASSYYAIAVLEAAIALLVIRYGPRSGMAIVLVFAAVSLFVFSDTRPCGCFGPIAVAFHVRRAIAAGIGVLAALGLTITVLGDPPQVLRETEDPCGGRS